MEPRAKNEEHKSQGNVPYDMADDTTQRNMELHGLGENDTIQGGIGIEQSLDSQAPIKSALKDKQLGNIEESQEPIQVPTSRKESQGEDFGEYEDDDGYDDNFEDVEKSLSIDLNSKS